MAKRETKRTRRLAAIRDLALRECWQCVDDAAWQALRRAFPEVSESTLRHDLRETELILNPFVEGVRLDSIEDLARTLSSLAAEYAAGRADSADPRRGAARKLVLDARRKAETVLRNPRVNPQKLAAMEEKFLWLRTWLENPALFNAWANLRRKKLSNPDAGP